MHMTPENKTEATSSNLVEKEDVTREYGFPGVNAIIDHQEHGRLLICDGFGGTDTLYGGAVRWSHGMAVKLLSADTLDSLKKTPWNDNISVFVAAISGHDDQRPVLGWRGSQVELVADSAGL